jgi:hypothetical protein
MRIAILSIVFVAVQACTPATIKRELIDHANTIKPQPVDAVEQIASQTHGGTGAAQPIDVPASVAIPSSGFGVPTPGYGLVNAVYTIIEANSAYACAASGKTDARSANCMTRYDGILVAPKQKGPVVNTERH